MSRLDNIADDDDSPTDTYAAYSYLGASTLIKVEYPGVTSGGNALALTYGTSADDYAGFDRFGRVVDQKWRFGTAGTVADRYTYGYDGASNRLYRKNELKPELSELYHANGSTNGYDGLDRLTDFRRGTLSASVQDGPLDTVATVSRIQEWTLDPVGNWNAFKSSGATTQPWDLDQSRAHNTANEIEDTVNQPPDDISGTPNWVDPNYDDAGNMTCGPKPGDETTKASLQLYKYDAWNRLTEVYTDADEYGDMDPGELVATYSYDGQHRRIEKVLGDPEDPDAKYDYYYNENWQVVEVHKDGEDDYPLEQYVWGAQYIDAPVVRFRDHTDGQGGGPDGTVDDTLYYTHDAQFNVTALVTPAGAVAERYAYDPYGQVTVLNGASGTDPDVTGGVLEWSADTGGSDYDNEILYCGYRFDPESGNYIVRNRYLTPPLGRWLTTDPIGYGDGMNRYQYAGSNPVVFTDGAGLWRVPRHGEARATATAQFGDTLRSLALTVDMSAKEVSLWARGTIMFRTSLKGGPQTVNINALSAAVIESTWLDELVCPGETLTVPNTGYIDVGTYTWGFLGWYLMGVKDGIKDGWDEEGLRVVYNGIWTSSRTGMILHMGADDIYKYAYIGHGAAGALNSIRDNPGGNGILTQDSYTQWGLARMLLIACESNLQSWGWAQNVSTSGELVTVKGVLSCVNMFSDVYVTEPGTR